MSTYGLVVIGSGPAGVSAAAEYAAAGGPGPIALLTTDTDEPYERPPLSKDVLSGAGPAERTPITEARLPSSAELHLNHTVTDIDLDGSTIRAGDQSFGFERLVVATGSRPLPFPDADADAEVHTLRSLEDARRLVRAAEHARTALVIGSGFIGCEGAASLARRGIATTLVTPEPAPQLTRLGAYAAEQIESWLTDLGVEVRTGVSVNGIRAPRTVHLSDGRTVSPDLVLAAVGIAPQGDLLAGAGIAAYEGRLVVDEYLQAAPGVWVAGDVARALHGVAGRVIEVEHWGDALAMGAVAGRNAAAGQDGAQEKWSEVPGFWSTIGHHTLQYAAWGDGFQRAEVVERVGGFTIWYADDDGTLVGVLSYNTDPDYERGRRLIAAAGSIDAAINGDDVPQPAGDASAVADGGA